MSAEMEVGGLASIGGVATKQKADLSGKPCFNCGTIVEDRYCSHCGQLAASFHRPVWSLIGETITDTLALDGRLSRTMPKLLFRPGALTKAYISGQRARYVPPFRLFLLASLVFYFALFTIIGNASWIDDLNVRTPNDTSASTAVEDDTTAVQADQSDQDAVQLIGPDGKVDRELIKGSINDDESIINDAMVDRAVDAYENPRLLLLGLEKWVPRLSFLFVPSTILALGILHFWRRKIYIYDHAIHALHLHTWIYLVGAVAMIAGMYVGGWIGLVFLIAFVAYVWRSLAVVGQTGIFISFLRLLNLLISWAFVAFILTILSIILGAIAL